MRTPPFWFFRALRYCHSGMCQPCVTSTHAAACLVVLHKLGNRLLLQRHELLRIVKIRSLVLGKQVGGDGAGVLLRREDRQGHGRAVIQQGGLDVLGAGLGAVLDLLKDAPLRLVAAQGQRLGLRQGESTFRQQSLCLLAQPVERQTPLDGGGAQSRLRDHIVQRDALVNQLGQRRRFFQRRHVLPLQILDGGDAQRLVLGEVVAHFHRDREILRQFAALLQQAQRLEAPRSADDLVTLRLAFRPSPG